MGPLAKDLACQARHTSMDTAPFRRHAPSSRGSHQLATGHLIANARNEGKYPTLAAGHDVGVLEPAAWHENSFAHAQACMNAHEASQAYMNVHEACMNVHEASQACMNVHEASRTALNHHNQHARAQTSKKVLVSGSIRIFKKSARFRISTAFAAHFATLRHKIHLGHF